ncbi:MAG: ACT domain-containing protein [Anaerolineae bacterium]|nr:ACT domain-containing protein [Phycisphaerae bacterium]
MLTLIIQPGEYSICRLSAGADIPANLRRAASFVSISRSADELSITCLSELAPIDCESRSDGWRCLRFDGVFDLSLTGILSSAVSPLAASQISVFAISTFDTDYILVRESDLPRAIEVLTQAGHRCRL